MKGRSVWLDCEGWIGFVRIKYLGVKHIATSQSIHRNITQTDV